MNTAITEGGLELESLALADLSTMELTNAEDENVVSDSGGIVGFSKGVVSGCVNRGTVGYPHFGYNVGGIAGRQSGYLTGCENRGEIHGRKDVGGIVGQMEPYLLLLESINMADELRLLNFYMNAASADVGQMSGRDAATRWTDRRQLRLRQREDRRRTTAGSITTRADGSDGAVLRRRRRHPRAERRPHGPGYSGRAGPSGRQYQHRYRQRTVPDGLPPTSTAWPTA